MELSLGLLLKIVIGLAVAAFLAWQLSLYTQGERHAREGKLDPFLPRLAEVRRGKDALGYPILAGSYGGADLRLNLFPDTLVLRTLPILWLQARWSRAHEGRLRVTLDPTGTEYYREPGGLHTRFAPPDSWERKAEVCGSGPQSLHLLSKLAEAPLKRFPALKEVDIEEQRLVLTFRGGRADRRTYRILRSAKFEGTPLSEEIVNQVLEALDEIEGALNSKEYEDE